MVLKIDLQRGTERLFHRRQTWYLFLHFWIFMQFISKHILLSFCFRPCLGKYFRAQTIKELKKRTHLRGECAIASYLWGWCCCLLYFFLLLMIMMMLVLLLLVVVVLLFSAVVPSKYLSWIWEIRTYCYILLLTLWTIQKNDGKQSILE